MNQPTPTVAHRQRKDHRSFVIPIHPTHGILLLHCTHKPKKGHHFQLPGGHMDDADLKSAESQTATVSEDATLLTAHRICAAREFYEETGIDLKDRTGRLEAAWVGEYRGTVDGQDAGCVLKNRCYFRLELEDDDFPKQSEHPGIVLQAPIDDKGSHLKLRLSKEHSGYRFETDVKEAAKSVKKHSGGIGSEALYRCFSSKFHGVDDNDDDDDGGDGGI